MGGVSSEFCVGGRGGIGIVVGRLWRGLVVRHATWEAWWSAKERWRSLEERGDGECSKGGVSGVRERLWGSLGQ